MHLANFLMETQVGIVHNDIEELHSPHVEYSQTEVLDGYDTEIIPDSDDDITYPLGSRQLSRGIASFIKPSRDLDEVNSLTHSPCKKLESLSINTNARDGVPDQDACMIFFQENYGFSVTAHHIKQATGLNVKDYDISETEDPCLANDIACDKKCIYNSGEVGEDTKIGEGGRTSKSAQRDASIVYVRKRKRTCSLGANNVEDEKRLMNRSDKGAYLSYVESQESEDVSAALHFVEQYVDSTALLSSPLVDSIVKDKSQSAQCVNRVQHLIGRANLQNLEKQRGIFEWDDRLDGNKESDASVNFGNMSFGVKKYDHTYKRRSRSVANMISKDLGNVGDLSKEKIENHDNLTKTDNTVLIDKCANYQGTEKINEKKDGRDSIVQDQQVNDKSVMMEFEACAEDLEYAFDVGINTQMAAEAIQALSYAPALNCNEVYADKCPQKMLNKSLNISYQKRVNAGNWSVPKKCRSASKCAVSEPEESRKLLSGSYSSKIKLSTSEVKGNSRKSEDHEFVDGHNTNDPTMVNVELKRKVNGAQNVKMEGSKENLWPLLSTEYSNQIVARKSKPLNLFHNNGGLNSTNSKTDVMKIDSYDRRKDMCVIEDQENFSKSLYMCLSDEDSVRQVADKVAVHKYVRKINHMETSLHEEDNMGDANMVRVSGPVQKLSKLPSTKLNDNKTTRAAQQKSSCALVNSEIWYFKDYPRGKQTCGYMLGESAGFQHSDFSSVKVTRGKHNLQNLKGHLNFEACFIPSFTVKKRRSSAYISPYRLSSQKNSEKRFVGRRVDNLKESCIVYDNDFGAKPKNLIEGMLGGVSTWKLHKADNTGFECTMDGRKQKTDSTLLVKNNTSSEDAAPSSILVDDCHQKHGKKKASTPVITRELARLGFKESMPEFSLKDSRRRKTMADIRVLFSKNLDKHTLKQQKKILTRFGVSMASCPSNATHFIADKFIRTRNMLEFIAEGKPVVTSMWLESCQQAGFYIDERSYILRDMKREQEFGFRLPFSLDQARKHPLLKGYKVIITPNTKPEEEMLTSLVKIAHGQVVDMLADAMMRENMILSNLLIFSCEEDQAYCLPFLERGASVYSSELLLNGIIIQKLEFERHQLFKTH
ncbi:uncharacterized protein LOC130813353 isoform X2 [Amaranthus tricolor]|uniref:uncharacterized protein LOC130813353 isoform X2 n=1 Tax=Amaranthus tricolor TaxID=29722 RepID=UPI00258CEE66|nr:uncharacterized protein LOC130813353 isoform X2 [Amaranthus tricolor]XP_057535163.1 uncharacterized protein LOC130813353 isoform X2 [Amaranthus tricolor]